MAASANVRLRCSSWSQLASIYRRDLARGQLFLKTARPLALGTGIEVKLLLPSGAAVDFHGSVSEQTGSDHPRGAGVLVKLDDLPADSKLRLETAIRTAEEHRERTGIEEKGSPNAPLSADESDGVLDAERELASALETELAAYRRLNPFQILGVGYNADNRAVHAAFADLSRRFHPDRYMRYQSDEIAAFAESLFVAAREAYRALANPEVRSVTLEDVRARRRPFAPAEIRAQNAEPEPSPGGIDPLAMFPEALSLLEEARFDDAMAVFHLAADDPERGVPAQIGIELVAGLQALAAGDRLGAVERFAAILERDPDNELAARELALLSQAHSSEQQSLLTKLVGAGK